MAVIKFNLRVIAMFYFKALPNQNKDYEKEGENEKKRANMRVVWRVRNKEVKGNILLSHNVENTSYEKLLKHCINFKYVYIILSRYHTTKFPRNKTTAKLSNQSENENYLEKHFTLDDFIPKTCPPDSELRGQTFSALIIDIQ